MPHRAPCSAARRQPWTSAPLGSSSIIVCRRRYGLPGPGRAVQQSGNARQSPRDVVAQWSDHSKPIQPAGCHITILACWRHHSTTLSPPGNMAVPACWRDHPKHTACWLLHDRHGPLATPSPTVTARWPDHPTDTACWLTHDRPGPLAGPSQQTQPAG